MPKSNRLPFRSVHVVRSVVWALAAGIATLAAAPASADDAKPYPKRTVRLIAAQEPGSATDKVARMLADALAEQWGAPVIVDNRPGAGGTIGAEAAARAAPDGYTLLVGGYSNLAVAPAMRSDIRYDPLRDFVPIGRIAHVPFVFAVNAAVPAKSLGEAIALARSQPGRLTYGSLGGGATATCMALLLASSGVDMLAIEYKGATSAITDLVAGRTDLMCNEIGALAPQAQAGRIRLLALAGPRRLAILPDLPTTAELGLREVAVAPWYGLLAPAGTPPEVLAKIAQALAAAHRSPTLGKRIGALGYEAIDDAPGTFARALQSDVDAARRVLGPAPAATAR